MSKSAAPTLTEALAALGIRHERTRDTLTTGKHDWYRVATGEHLGAFDAFEGWAKVERLSTQEAA